MPRQTVQWILGGVSLAVVVGLASGLRARAADESKADEAQVDQARQEVKKLDGLYKTAVVSITDIYKDGPPAIKVAKKVFEAMDKAGHHSARLVDASGVPLNEANLPQTEFEKRAAKAIQAGKPFYEEIVTDGTGRRYMAATVVPAVHKRCASCHGVKEGDLLGFIRYDLPIK